MRKIIALPFGLIFVVLLLATIWVFSLRSFAFDPGFYTANLKDQGLFQAIQNDPMTYFNWSGSFSQLKALPLDTQRRIFNEAVPPGWIDKEVGAAIQSVMDWLHTDQSPPPHITIDFRPVKDRLQGPPGQQIAADVVALIPECGPNDHPDLSGSSVPSCLPAGIDRGQVTDYVVSVISDAATNIPETLDVGPGFVNSGRWNSLITGRSWIRLLDVGILVLVVIALLVWFIGALIAGKDSRDGLRWAGGWLLGGSIIVLALSVLMLIERDAILSSASFVRSANDNITPATRDAIRNVASNFIQQFAVRSIIPAGILFVLSFGLIVLGRSRSSATSPSM
jgi:hypothetical protein